MFARLTALVSSGSSLPFDLGEPLGSTWGAWAHFRGTAKADGSPVSIFRISAQSKQDPKLVAARNGAKRLRMVGVWTGTGLLRSNLALRSLARSCGVIPKTHAVMVGTVSTLWQEGLPSRCGG